MGEACERARLDFCPLGCSGRGECRAAPPAAGALPGVKQSARASLAARAAARLLFYSMDPAQYSTALPPAPPPASPRGVCVCRAASFGSGCEETDDAGAAAGACPSLCSGHGLCREQGCACEAGYGGDDCGVACPDECNGNGRCSEQGECQCEPGWFGPSCANATSCPNGCSGRGLCVQPSQQLVEHPRQAAIGAQADLVPSP